jgi:Na+-transporting NADH:ubiquinone oxidoreductase subunit A
LARHTNRKGIDLPLAGAPASQIDSDVRITRVALLGADYVGLKLRLLAQPGDEVLRGQPLYEDKSTGGVVFTALAAGRLEAVHRGERRAFISAVIAVADDDADPARQIDLPQVRAAQSARLDRAHVVAALCESGLWTALRERPFGRVPAPQTEPQALFVTAMDSRPHAPPVAAVLAGREDDFVHGVAALSQLTHGPVYVCKAAATALPPLDAAAGRVRIEEFAGPHPSGNVSWHIHTLHPVDLGSRVWHVGLQDVLAIGRLLRSGRLDVERVISLAGPGVVQPRLLRVRLGAAVHDIVNGGLRPGEQRVISGSVLDGRAVGHDADAVDGYLGRYHAQIAVLPEGRGRELLGWIAPAPDKFSITGAVLGAFRRNERALSTTTNGSPRAMVPIGTYERVLPFDILPTLLLRALITRDDERARQLGALELDEDDIALATCVCPGKYEYGSLLRDALTRIEKEAA